MTIHMDSVASSGGGAPVPVVATGNPSVPAPRSVDAYYLRVGMSFDWGFQPPISPLECVAVGQGSSFLQDQD